MGNWYTADMSKNGWGAWEIQVQLATMTDGTIVPIGLRVEPVEDYNGKRNTQRITTEKLRRFPIGLATQLAKAAASNDPWDELAARAEAQIHQADDLTRRIGNLRAQVERQDDEQRRQRALEIGERMERLERVAALYRVFQARPLPDGGGVREELKSALGVSVTTVDRLLREARKEGLLEPYDGPQGKHGKKTPAPRKGKRATERKTK